MIEKTGARMAEQESTAAGETRGGTGVARIGQVVYPVADVEGATVFFSAVFGFARKFVDGDRYAALDAGTTTWAVAGPSEDVAGGVVAAAVKVVDVHDTLGRVVAAGGRVLRPAEEGPHEVRAVIQDPWGNAVIVYAPLRDPAVIAGSSRPGGGPHG